MSEKVKYLYNIPDILNGTHNAKKVIKSSKFIGINKNSFSWNDGGQVFFIVTAVLVHSKIGRYFVDFNVSYDAHSPTEGVKLFRDVGINISSTSKTSVHNNIVSILKKDGYEPLMDILEDNMDNKIYKRVYKKR